VIPLSGPERGSNSTRNIWLLVGLLLAIGIIVPLWVTLYDQETPALFGFPFYYWFQFLLVPVVAILTFVSFKLAETATDRDRKARGLGPAAGHTRPDGDER
jgi:uncharacterized membrane protein